jgi:copper(I)-binding protein
MTLFKSLLSVAALCVALPAFAGDIEVKDAYVRTSSMMSKSGAAFMVIENHGDADDRLVSAASDVAQKVELHTHKDMGDGVMKMMKVEEGFAVPAHSEHALARGGDHVMLLGLTRELKQGDMVSVTLTFEKAGEMTVEIPVDLERQDGMQMGGGMGHDHSKMNHGQTGASN